MGGTYGTSIVRLILVHVILILSWSKKHIINQISCKTVQDVQLVITINYNNDKMYISYNNDIVMYH